MRRQPQNFLGDRFGGYWRNVEEELDECSHKPRSNYSNRVYWYCIKVMYFCSLGIECTSTSFYQDIRLLGNLYIRPRPHLDWNGRPTWANLTKCSHTVNVYVCTDWLPWLADLFWPKTGEKKIGLDARWKLDQQSLLDSAMGTINDTAGVLIS